MSVRMRTKKNRAANIFAKKYWCEFGGHLVAFKRLNVTVAAHENDMPITACDDCKDFLVRTNTPFVEKEHVV